VKVGKKGGVQEMMYERAKTSGRIGKTKPLKRAKTFTSVGREVMGRDGSCKKRINSQYGQRGDKTPL